MAQDKPTPVSLNLDTLEREGAPDQFSVVLSGRRVVFIDAQEIDYRELISLMTDPMRFFDVALQGEDRDHFAQTPIPAWKMTKLVNAYLTHFGIDPGNPGASSPS